MKKTLVASCLLFSISVLGQSAMFDTSAALHSLKLSSQKMRQSLVNKNFTEFAKFVYPSIIQMAGGRDQMIELTKKSFKDLESQGFVVSDVTVADPSKIINSGNRWQSVVQENLTIKTKGGHLIAKSYLVAISEDLGSTWYFIDTSGKTLEQMKTMFSFLSNNLVLPKKEQPLFYKD